MSTPVAYSALKGCAYWSIHYSFHGARIDIIIPPPSRAQLDKAFSLPVIRKTHDKKGESSPYEMSTAAPAALRWRKKDEEQGYQWVYCCDATTGSCSS
jgi:hypothetical protein